MSFRSQADLAVDHHLQRRASACAAREGIPEPEAWALAHSWELSAQPGWDAAYESAVLNGNLSPGNTQNVITDQMILSAVQAIRAKEAAG